MRHRKTNLGARTALASFAAILACATAATPALAAGPPIVTGTAFSEVTETSVKLEASLNPNGKKVTDYHFEYITDAAWRADNEQFGEGAESTPVGALPEGTEAVPVTATLTNLAPATIYRFRLFAHNGKGDSFGETLPFATYSTPLAGLPDGRAYEQASPIDKDGGDATGIGLLVRAASGGGSATFASTSGIPGGVGAQEMPLFLASRGAGESGWSSAGLLPAAELGQRAQVIGWTPDLSEFFQTATIFGEPSRFALFMRSAAGAETQIAPYVPHAGYAYAGASADGSLVLFESTSAQLPTAPAGREGASNLYAWDRESGQLSLASQMNTQAETESLLPKGAFAGPYEWMHERTSQGGAAAKMYVQDPRAVSADGSVIFTAAGSGHIYERLNPTRPQSPMNGKECEVPADACTLDLSAPERTVPDPGGPRPAAFMAASADGQSAFFTSPEKLTDDANTGPEVPPPAIGRATIGPAPEEEAEDELDELLSGHHAVGIAVQGECLYWADPVDGTIGRAQLDGSGDLVPGSAEDDFILPGETEAETHPETEQGAIQSAPSTPRYVAARGKFIYWTNTGPLGGDANLKQLEGPTEGAGTIGRAELSAPCGTLEGTPEPAFIEGASDPQGIAVNSEHIYWANSLANEFRSELDIARAGIEGDAVEQQFHDMGNVERPHAVALSATDVYFTKEIGGFGGFSRIPLEGGSESTISLAKVVTEKDQKPRGITLWGPHLYWTAQGTGTIGRVAIADFPVSGSSCGEIPSCEPEFLTPGGSLAGLAADGASHLFWSANGEVPPHPGNDLYRYSAQADGEGHHLTDLAPDPGTETGADVQGVLGASADGKSLYFVANAVLAANQGARGQAATPGSCQGRFAELGGSCNLYLWQDDGSANGEIVFIARLNAGSASGNYDDALNWEGGTGYSAVEGSQKTSFTSADGGALLFRSEEQLTEHPSQGVSELYLYRIGRGIVCVSCSPTLAAPEREASLGSVSTTNWSPVFPAPVASHLLASTGDRAFFETTEALSPTDTNGAEGCPGTGGGLQSGYRACKDVYEWEEPGAGSCAVGSPGYSPADQGCLYLISRGKGSFGSILADASASGDDVFLFSREALVGQDTDQLLDLYDARVGGGIASQSPPPPKPPCEAEGCKPEVGPSPALASPATPGFRSSGNVNEKPKPKCPKGKVRRHGRCIKKTHHHHNRGAKR
ncbi:MAG TPA: hypothetical protein VFS64_09980 [Solirubrobacterales bacterium]|nr:hypothetical protein [Solirubrobacterales bacterium]